MPTPTASYRRPLLALLLLLCASNTIPLLAQDLESPAPTKITVSTSDESPSPPATTKTSESQPALNPVIAAEIELIDQEIASLNDAAKAFGEHGQRYRDQGKLSESELDERGYSKDTIEFWIEHSETQKKSYLDQVAELEQQKAKLLSQPFIAPHNLKLVAREAALRHELAAAQAKYKELLYLRLQLQGYNHEYKAVLDMPSESISNPAEVSSNLKSEIPSLKAKIIQLTGDLAETRSLLESSKQPMEMRPIDSRQSSLQQQGPGLTIVERLAHRPPLSLNQPVAASASSEKTGVQPTYIIPTATDLKREAIVEKIRRLQSKITDSFIENVSFLEGELQKSHQERQAKIVKQLESELTTAYAQLAELDLNQKLNSVASNPPVSPIDDKSSRFTTSASPESRPSITRPQTAPTKTDEEPGAYIPYISAQFHGELRFDKLDLPPVKLVFEQRGRRPSPVVERTKVPVGVHPVTLIYSQEVDGQSFSVPLILEVLPEVNQHDVGPVELSFRFMLNDLDSIQKQIFGQACVLYETPNTRIGANGRPAPTGNIEIIYTISDLETVRKHAGPSQSGGYRMMPDTNSEGATVAIIYSPDFNQRIPFQRQLVSVMSGFRGGGGIVTLYTPDQLPEAGVPVTIYSLNPNAKSAADLELKAVMNDHQFDHSDAGAIYLKQNGRIQPFSIQNLMHSNTQAGAYVMVPAATYTPDIIAEKVLKQIREAVDIPSPVTPVQNPSQQDTASAPVIEIYQGVDSNDYAGKEITLTDRRASAWVQSDPVLKAEDIKSLDTQRGIRIFLNAAAMEKIKNLPPIEKSRQWIVRVDDGYYPAMLAEDGFILMVPRRPELLKRVEQFSKELSATKKESP